MEQLISVLEGEAKRAVEFIGCNGIFYATALKSLLDQPQLKANKQTVLDLKRCQ